MASQLQDQLLVGDDAEQQQHVQTAHPRCPSSSALMAAGFGLGTLCTLVLTLLVASGEQQGATQHPHAMTQTTAPVSAQSDPNSAVHRCQAYLDRSFEDGFSLILTADPGDFSGVSEAHYILENLRYRQDTPRDRTVCGGQSTGMLMGQPALVVTTGIGPSAASLCTYEVLSNCGPLVREAIYFGTSGWSPQQGGLLNPPSCSTVNWRPNVTRTGDVCISPFSVNWTCKKSSWSAQAAGAPNQCSRPEEGAGPADTPLFGQCQFYDDNIRDNLRLADDLIDVATSSLSARNFPARSRNVTDHERGYWSAVAAAAGQQPPTLSPTTPPNIWDYTQCMEVDGQFFFSGSPWELKAREYAAETLNAALALPELAYGQAAAPSLSRRLPKQVTASDMIAVSAMEGVGVSEALLRYHDLSTTRRIIPFTNVRTLSNWMLQPVTQTKPGVWEVQHEVPEDFVNGYAYAIATGSATILSLYQDRCLQQLGSMQGLRPGVEGASRRCSFVIDPDNAVRLLLASGKHG